MCGRRDMMIAATDTEGGFSPARLAGAIAAVAFAASAVVLATVHGGLGTVVAGSALVAVVSGGAIYAWLLLPLRTHFEDRLALARDEPRGEPLDPSVDSLTRTLNRRGATVALLELMALADRYGHRLSVAMVAIDRLEQINQEQGTPAGDQMLVSVAETLANTLRMPDRVGRYSGNEYLLILPETVLEDACRLAERIRGEAEHMAVKIGDEQVYSTLSIGVTEFRRGEDLELFVSRAERAIVEARGKGYNSVVCAQAA